MVNERCLHCSVETDLAERERVTPFRGVFFAEEKRGSAIADQCEKAPARLDMVTQKERTSPLPVCATTAAAAKCGEVYGASMRVPCPVHLCVNPSHLYQATLHPPHHHHQHSHYNASLANYWLHIKRTASFDIKKISCNHWKHMIA